MDLQNVFSMSNYSMSNLSLNNPFVMQTLFALGTVALGLMGTVLGQKLAANGPAALVVGLLAGLGAMALLTTTMCYVAPGWAIVFVGTFLTNHHLARLACSKK